jgi:predicted HicB family RNase H-like nuclease
VARLNLSIPDEVHNRARAAAGYAGVTLTEWVARVMAAAADDELARRAEEERRRRGR